MKNRISNMIGINSYSMQISTFHSFGLKLLKENYNVLGYEKNFVIMDSDDSLSIVKKIMKDLNYDSTKITPKYVRGKISEYKNNLISLESLSNMIGNDIDEKVYNVYKKYINILKSNNSVDFDDLLILPIKLFKENKHILEYYQDIYKYILVDEYQDTNQCQYIICKLLSEKHKNITCVGDDSQSIYSFRGANYKNILNFEKDYKDAKIIFLEQNYRSTKNILDAANSVIKNNKEKKDKSLWTNNDYGEKITYYKADDEKDESLYITNIVKKLLNDNIKASEICILYRTNAQSRVIEEAFLNANIPYKIIGSFYFYSRKEIKDLLAYLRLIYNHNDDISLLRIINRPKRKIGAKTIEKLYEEKERLNVSLFDAIKDGKELIFKKLILELTKYKDELSLTELVDKVLELSGLKKELELDHSLESDIRLENLEEFKSITKNFEANEGVVSLGEFLESISLVSDYEDYNEDLEKVNLMTLHSVKGLEFDYVFITGLEEGIFPHINSLYSSYELEEERRLMYVGLTRAKKKLFLLNTRRRTLFGMNQINPGSRFLEEINEELIEKDEKNIESKKTNNPFDVYKSEDVDYQVGDFVFHETFGQGKVVNVSETLVSVAFKYPHQVKKLMKNHKKLSKVN